VGSDAHWRQAPRGADRHRGVGLLISRACAKHLYGADFSKRLRPYKGGRINAAAGAQLEILGSIPEHVRLASCTREASLLVADGLQYDIILGNDTLRRFELWISPAEEKMVVAGEEVRARTTRRAEKEEERVLALELEHSVTIPARSYQMITIRSSTGHGNGGARGMLEQDLPSKQTEKHKRMRFTRGLGVIDENGRTRASIANFDDHAVRLKASQRVATWSPIDNEKGQGGGEYRDRWRLAEAEG
jgi:hypothetical protein